MTGRRTWPSSLLAVLWRLLAGWTLVLVVVVSTGWMLAAVSPKVQLLRSEDGVDRALVRARTPTLDDVTSVFTHQANTGAIVVTALAAALVLRRLLRRWRESLFVALATWGQSTVFLLTTLLVDRPRPHVPHLDRAPPTSSFPSGHTAAATAYYLSTALIIAWHTKHVWLRWLVVVIGVLIPITVATCRMYRGMHYPTDTATSFLLGIALVAIAFHALPLSGGQPDDGARRRHRVAARPAPTTVAPPSTSSI